MSTLLITGGRVIDPSQAIDKVCDVWIQDGRFIDSQAGLHADRTIDAKGREEDETIATGAAAAVAGGVTSVACMPNTEPPIDNQAAVEFVYLQAKRAGMANVFPIGCITKGRKGDELAEIGQMVAGGAVAFTDDGSPVTSAEMMRRALEYSTMFDKAILSHCEDLDLTRGGVMHEGLVSVELGVRGMPALAEELHVFREIELARLTGGRVHILHVSTAGSVELIRRAKAAGVRVTGEACPHHFLLTDESLRTFDSNFKMSPPLRSPADAAAVLAGIIDGTLDVIATDHAPHAPEKKAHEFDQCPNGILGVETLLPLCITHLIEPGRLTWSQLIEKVAVNPAKVLSIDRGTLKPGTPADVTIIDPNAEWLIDVNRFRSKSRNCPFDGWNVQGRAETVIVGGIVKV